MPGSDDIPRNALHPYTRFSLRIHFLNSMILPEIATYGVNEQLAEISDCQFWISPGQLTRFGLTQRLVTLRNKMPYDGTMMFAALPTIGVLTMSVALSPVSDGAVMTIEYQPRFDATQDVWQSLRSAAGSSVRIHDFTAISLTRLEMRQILFLLRENETAQRTTFHTVIVAGTDQARRFTEEMAKCPGRERLIPIFGKQSEALVYAAMLVIKDKQESITA